jgi:hypothetical protein
LTQEDLVSGATDDDVVSEVTVVTMTKLISRAFIIFLVHEDKIDFGHNISFKVDGV